MKVLYKIEDKEILEEKLLDDGFKIVLARWVRAELQNEIQYITWLLNPKTNSTHQGNYFESLESAYSDYLKRIA